MCIILLICAYIYIANFILNLVFPRYSIQVQREDKEICERLQKGMRSKSFTHGRYSPLLENAQHDYHRALARDLKRGLEEMEKREAIQN